MLLCRFLYHSQLSARGINMTKWQTVHTLYSTMNTLCLKLNCSVPQELSLTMVDNKVYSVAQACMTIKQSLHVQQSGIHRPYSLHRKMAVFIKLLSNFKCGKQLLCIFLTSRDWCDHWYVRVSVRRQLNQGTIPQRKWYELLI